jgi:branched-chain amino acid transport system ATP-binding protein
MANASPTPPPVLEVSKLTKRFRGLLALQGVNLSVPSGVIHGVIGPNGAGKTTLFNCLTGQTTATQGQICFKGQDITRLSAPAIARLGIARTFQNIRLFGGLSVLDNVRVAQQLRTAFGLSDVLLNLPSFRRKEQTLTDEAINHLKLFGLESVADRPATGLPYGMQRRLEIARALATGPELLLLDEPAAGMNASETDTLHQMILEVQKRFKLTIVLVEHDMRLVMNMCDRITVFSYGRVLAEGTPEDIRQDPAVIESYLGTTKRQKVPPSSLAGKQAET